MRYERASEEWRWGWRTISRVVMGGRGGLCAICANCESSHKSPCAGWLRRRRLSPVVPMSEDAAHTLHRIAYRLINQECGGYGAEWSERVLKKVNPHRCRRKPGKAGVVTLYLIVGIREMDMRHGRQGRKGRA